MFIEQPYILAFGQTGSGKTDDGSGGGGGATRIGSTALFMTYFK